MSDGFLGQDASFMLDVLACALVLVIPWLAVSLWMVRQRQRHLLHKRLQIGLTILLIAAVAGFEIDLHVLHGGWQDIVNRGPGSPRVSGAHLKLVRYLLGIHLVFAVTTPVVWGVTLALALRRFPNPPQPGSHSRWHARLGWISAIDLALTSVTGIAFYIAAFAWT